jgi:arylsulfatase A-like enzyme
MAVQPCANFVVLCFENLHLGFLGPYGNATVDTEHFDRLAAEGVVLDNYYAEIPDCVATRQAVWQGIPVLWRGQEMKRPAFQDFQEHGVRTVWFGSQPSAERLQHLLSTAFAEAIAVEVSDNPEGVLSAAVDWLSTHRHSGRFVLWIDLPGLRPPRQVPEVWRGIYTEELSEAKEATTGLVTFRTLESKGLAGQPVEEEEEAAREVLWGAIVDNPESLDYAAMLTWMDDLVGYFLDALRDSPLWESTGIAVTADHGEELLRPAAGKCDGLKIHDELVHLPLVIRVPGCLRQTGRSRSFYQPADFGIALLKLMGIPVAAPPVGIKPLELAVWAIEDEGRTGLALADPGRTQWGWRTPDWLLVTTLHPTDTLLPEDPWEREERIVSASRLYAKPDDRWERHECQHIERALCVELFGALRQYLTICP